MNSLDELYAAYREDVYRLVYILTGDRAVSESVTQEVFYASPAAGTSRVRLLADAREKALSLFRRERRGLPLHGPLPYKDAPDLDFLDTLKPLAPRGREMVVYHILYGLPYPDIAAILSISQEAVSRECGQALLALDMVARRKEEFSCGEVGRPPETGL
ncbi:MAG: hypothetical protein LBI19_07125 [Oscillospiraceae bacterium]|jgi:DNA-directed RNA polymerase specialized sigma24 family protein|nr:hypothetical protein [Oscillospiraceae bacterium]